MRGTAAITRNRRCRLGIIPARAGNSFTVSAISASVRDHPRACGEQVALADDVGEEEGSSPRVRGTADNARAAVHGIGIIPARAGNSRLMHHNSSSDTGSSPRVRGTGAVAVMERVVDGIIPARAGNRRRSIEPISAIRDHPRACGEQSCRCPLPVRGAGSSPRVRGTDVPAQAVLRDGGIIPARAGNSFQFRVRTIDTRDHPRACGEQYFRQYGKTWYEGSSPRVRGTVRQVLAVRAGGGIIPARAGNRAC